MKSYIADLTQEEVNVFVRGFFDENFPENISLLKFFFLYIRTHRDSNFSAQLSKSLSPYFNDKLSYKGYFLVMVLTDTLLNYWLSNNHFEAIALFIDHKNDNTKLKTSDELNLSVGRLVRLAAIPGSLGGKIV